MLHDFPHRLTVRISKVDKPPPSKLLAYRDCQLPFIPYRKRHFSIGNGVIRERQWYDFVERQSEMEEGVEGLQGGEGSLRGYWGGRNELILALEVSLGNRYSQLIGEGWIVASR